MSLGRKNNRSFPVRLEAFDAQPTSFVLLSQSCRRYYQGMSRTSPVLLTEDKGFICEGLIFRVNVDHYDCILFFSLNNLLNHVGIMAAQKASCLWITYQMNVRHARITKYSKIFQAWSRELVAMTPYNYPFFKCDKVFPAAWHYYRFGVPTLIVVLWGPCSPALKWASCWLAKSKSKTLLSPIITYRIISITFIIL